MSKRAALKALQDVPATEDDRTVGGDESVSEALSKQVFTSFKSSSRAIDRGLPHPGETAVEATSLGAFRHFTSTGDSQRQAQQTEGAVLQPQSSCQTLTIPSGTPCQVP